MKISQGNLRASFYLKRNVVCKGLCPVMGRTTIGKEMVRFSCKLEAGPKLWDTRAGRLNGKSDHTRAVNAETDRINVSIHAGYSETLALKGTATPLEVKEAFQGIATSQAGVLELFDEHSSEFEKRVGVNRSVRARWKYRNAYRYLQRFITHRYRMPEVPLRQPDRSFIEDYGFYLRIDCRQMPSSVLCNITPVRRIIKIALRRGIIRQDPFSGYSPERPESIHRYLPREELSKMMSATFSRPQLNFIRDMFVFSCFTGLSFSDLYRLTHRQAVKTEDGTRWLMINRQKTDTPSNVPLLDIPMKIIDKYRGTTDDDRVFPMISCGLTNACLKEIARECSIRRRLTFHTSRHAFAAEICLSQGVPIETTGQMMGHSSMHSTQIYGEITHQKVGEDMKKLAARTTGKYAIVLKMN